MIIVRYNQHFNMDGTLLLIADFNPFVLHKPENDYSADQTANSHIDVQIIVRTNHIQADLLDRWSKQEL